MAWDIVGHERAVQLLQAALRTDQLPQSLVLTGPRQVGKRTLALELARAANCSGAGLNADSEAPCGACRACRLTPSGGYPDVHLAQLREGRQKIGIADVQELQTALARKPSEGSRRIALIRDAERLSAEAENCLLKTLEEPPPRALIVVTVEQAEALLPTTVSRCRQIRLRAVPPARIAAHLTSRLGVDRERASLLAGFAEGRPGWAIAACSESGRLEAYRAALERLQLAIEADKLRRLEISRGLAESWSGKSEQVREELRIWCRWWRDLLLTKLDLTSHLGQVDRRDELRRQALSYSAAELRAGIAVLAQARADLDQNVNPRLALDYALLHLPSPAKAA